MNKQIESEISFYADKIADFLCEGQFLPVIQTKSQTAKNWRQIVPYSTKTADALILQTKTYIRTLNKPVEFVNEFIENLATYLADYFVKNHKFNASKFNAAAYLQDELSACVSEMYKQDKSVLAAKKRRRHEHHYTVRQDAAAEKKPGLVAGSTKDGIMYRKATMSDGKSVLIASGYKKNQAALTNYLVEKANGNNK